MRKYRGSPAISTLTINDLLCLVDATKLEMRAESVVAKYNNDELFINDEVLIYDYIELC